MEGAAEAGAVPVLVITAHPSLEPLAAALAAVGLQPLRTHDRDVIARYLAGTGRHCAAVLDATRPAPYSFAALYHLLHQEPAIPTLLVLSAEGAPPIGPGGLAPLDDFVRLPAQPAELTLRVQALLLRADFAGTAPPPVLDRPLPVVTAGAISGAPPQPPEPVSDARSTPTAEPDAADPSHPAALPDAPADSVALPAGVRLFTDSHLVIGQIDPGRRRLSDHLNDPQRSYVEVAHGYWCDLLGAASPPLPAGAVTVRKEILQVVVPPEEPPARSAARIPTLTVTVAVALPLFLVVGNVHRRTGEPSTLLQWFLESGRQFIPMSAATVRFLPNPRFDATVPLALVNIRQVHCWWAPEEPPDA